MVAGLTNAEAEAHNNVSPRSMSISNILIFRGHYSTTEGCIKNCRLPYRLTINFETTILIGRTNSAFAYVEAGHGFPEGGYVDQEQLWHGQLRMGQPGGGMKFYPGEQVERIAYWWLFMITKT